MVISLLSGPPAVSLSSISKAHQGPRMARAVTDSTEGQGLTCHQLDPKPPTARPQGTQRHREGFHQANPTEWPSAGLGTGRGSRSHSSPPSLLPVVLFLSPCSPGMAPLPPSTESFCQMQITCASSAQTAQKTTALGALGTVILGLWDLPS